MSLGKWMFLSAKCKGTSPHCFIMYSGRDSSTSARHLFRADSISLFITFPVTPAFFSLSVLGYTPVIDPPAGGVAVLPRLSFHPVPVCGAPDVLPVTAEPVGKVGAASTSGWTMFIRPLNAVGFPKKMNSAPGFSLSYIHLIPLKKTISISPVPSLTHALIRRIVLNFNVLPALPAAPELLGPPSIPAPLPDGSPVVP